jgi:DhnA family fructose-bisphosphate aldolase class Ia
VLNNYQRMLNTGRLGGTGYVSILPVDQGIEHSAGASFAPNPDYFDAEKIVELAIEGGCNAVASTFGVLGMCARKYAHKIPFIVKFNHNELMTYPNIFKQIPFGNIRQCWEMGAAAVGATIYFGSETPGDQIQYVSDMFAEAHELGMVTVLWCYIRNTRSRSRSTASRTTTPPPTSPARPTTSAPPSRPTSSSRSSRPGQRRVQGPQHGRQLLRQVQHRRSTPSSPAATRTARAATRST